MKPWTRDELMALGPRARAQLEAQGIDLSEPANSKWLDINGEEITYDDLKLIRFKKPVRGITYSGKGRDLGSSAYHGKFITELEGFVVWELPFPGRNLVVKTTRDNVIEGDA